MLSYPKPSQLTWDHSLKKGKDIFIALQQNFLSKSYISLSSSIHQILYATEVGIELSFVKMSDTKHF